MKSICNEYKTFDVYTSEGIKRLQLCTEWVEHSVLPTLSNADRDAMILFFIGVFVLVFAYKQIRKLF